MRSRIVGLSVLAAVLAIALFGLPLAAMVVKYSLDDERGELERVGDLAAVSAAARLALGQRPNPWWPGRARSALPSTWLLMAALAALDLLAVWLVARAMAARLSRRLEDLAVRARALGDGARRALWYLPMNLASRRRVLPGHRRASGAAAAHPPLASGVGFLKSDSLTSPPRRDQSGATSARRKAFAGDERGLASAIDQRTGQGGPWT